MWEIDTREPSYILEFFQKKGIPYESKKLTIGDYVYNGQVGFERKSYDFFNIPDVFAKVDELRLAFPNNAYLILDINFEDLISRTEHIPNPISKRNQMVGMVGGLVARGVHPIFCSSSEYMVDIMRKIVEKTTDGKDRSPKLRNVRGSSLYTMSNPSERLAMENPEVWRITFLCSLPRVGETVARQILKDWGTPGMFLALDPDEAYGYLRTLRAITDERAKAIVNIIWGQL